MKIIFNKYKSQLWIFLWLICFLGIFLIIYFYLNNLNSQYFKPKINQKKYFYIYPNTDYNTLLKNLKDSFDISDNIFFNTYIKKKNLTRFKPGKYEFDSSFSFNDIINEIRIPENRVNVWFSFNASDNFGMIASKFINTFPSGKDSTFTNFPNPIDSIDVINGIYNYDYSDYIDFSIDSNLVKALFIPDKYKFNWHNSIDGFVSKMLEKYKEYWNSENRFKLNVLNEKWSNCYLTIIDVSILASIVYKEAKHESEYERIAGLYLNRLNKGWKLEADPTVNYAFQEKYGFDTVLTRVLNKHTRINSKYNTYKNIGLPPAPICIPSKQALDAVLNAEKHDYWFMCAKVEIDESKKYIYFPGLHSFSKSVIIHNKYANKYRSALNKINKKESKYKVCYNHYYHTDLDCLNNKEK